MKLKLILALSMLLSITFTAKTQSYHEPLWGKVTEADLKMTTYAPDTSAAAVVLLDNGFLTVKLSDGQWKCTLNSFHRVKILKKSAFDDYGKHAISMRTSENLINIRAQTINPDGTKIPVSEFFDEKANKYSKQKKFAFPKLQEGSIVEYEYAVESTNIFSLYPWYFQAAVPVRHSELVVDMPMQLEYIFLFNGGQPLKRDSVVENNKKKVFSPTYYRYSLDSVEAMKSEGYITTMDDYVSHLKFQLATINPLFGDEKPRKVLQDWQTLAEELINDKDLGVQLTSKSKYNDIWKAVKPLLANAQTDEEKTRIIYEFISNNVSWIDDYFGIYVQESSLDEAFKKKKANSGELNMMLIACLNEAGIKAFPLLVSTRDNGKPYQEYPMVRQFNHLLCYIEKDNKPVFLDAGNTFRPMNVPRIPSLNGSGWVLDKKNPRWVNIPTPLSNETMLATLDLLEDGTLKGTMASSYLGYAAVDERMALKDDEKNEKLKKSWAVAFPDIQLDSIVVTNKDSLYLPFKRTMKCMIPNAAIVADNLLYFKPTLKTNFDENPFKQEKRNYPVDLPYPIRDHFVMNLSIPEGYDIEELPKATSIALPNGGGKFVYSCTPLNGQIQLMVRVELKQLHFEVEEYGNIKAFFNQIVTKKSEQIVFKKKKV